MPIFCDSETGCSFSFRAYYNGLSLPKDRREGLSCFCSLIGADQKQNDIIKLTPASLRMEVISKAPICLHSIVETGNIYVECRYIAISIEKNHPYSNVWFISRAFVSSSPQNIAGYRHLLLLVEQTRKNKCRQKAGLEAVAFPF